jgi:hypothetical protein
VLIVLGGFGAPRPASDANAGASSAAVAGTPSLLEPSRAITTRLTPRAMVAAQARKVSRTARLIRFRTTALPIFLVTVIPRRVGPSLAATYTTRK